MVALIMAPRYYAYMLIKVFLCTSGVHSAIVTVTPSPIAQVTQGETLWITCQWHDSSIVALKWIGGQFTGQIGSFFPKHLCPSNKSVEYTFLYYTCDKDMKQFSVGINETSYRNGDKFICVGYQSGGIDIRDETIVLIPVLVTYISFTTDPPYVIPEDEIKIYICQTSRCRPPATIEWYKDGLNIANSSNGTNTTIATNDTFITTGTLTVRGQRGDYNASIQCKATNIKGMAPVLSETKYLTVQWSPAHDPYISGYAEGYIMYAGDMKTLTCQQDAGNPFQSLTWSGICAGHSSINTRNTTIVSTVLRLTLTSTMNQHRCSCVSTHLISGSRTKYVTFTVYYPPSSPVITQSPSHALLANKQGIFTCKALPGYPTATQYRWFIEDDTAVIGRTKSLTINPTKVDNQRDYTCQVDNDFTIYKNSTVKIVSTLNVLYGPDVTLNTNDLYVFVGNSIERVCTSTGNPSPVLSWFYKGTMLPGSGGTGETFTIKNVGTNASGLYMCRAEVSSSLLKEKLISEKEFTLKVYKTTETKDVSQYEEISQRIDTTTLDNPSHTMEQTESKTSSSYETLTATREPVKMYEELNIDKGAYENAQITQ